MTAHVTLSEFHHDRPEGECLEIPAGRDLRARIDRRDAYTYLSGDPSYLAAIRLAARIGRAQNDAIAARCTCGGLRHHRATCPAVALCAGCVHEG